jgi:hypothetical protein
MQQIRTNLTRPEAKEDDEGEIADSNDIISHAPGAFETPRAPCQTAVVRFIDVCFVEDGEGRVWVVEVAAEAAPEEQADGEEVGEVEAFEDEGDCAVEGGAVADVDEGEEGGEDGDDEDGYLGDGAALVDLGDLLAMGAEVV